MDVNITMQVRAPPNKCLQNFAALRSYIFLIWDIPLHTGKFLI